MGWMQSFVKTACTYSLNTCTQIFQQAAALGTAIPSLISDKGPRKIANNLAYMFAYDVLPIVSLNCLNTQLQTYFHNETDTELSWFAPYSMFLGTLVLIDYTVTAYTWRQGLQSLIRITVLDNVAPLVLNNAKPKAVNKVPACNEKECTTGRKFKGTAREVLILAANDVFAQTVSYIPRIGQPASRVLRIFFNGRYIARSITPERCERHKFDSIMQETVLALGLTYEFTRLLLETALERTVGLPPYLFLRTTRHLLLLLHVHLSVHMHLPDPDPKQTALSLDVLNLYERSCRFVADVVFAGLQARIPKDFPMDKDAKPLITQRELFELLTKIFKADLETEHSLTQRETRRKRERVAAMLLPPILRGTHGFVNDPIVANFWPTLQRGMLWLTNLLQEIHGDRRTKTLAMAPKEQLILILYLVFGLPEGAAELMVDLNADPQFWVMVAALKAWLERHGLNKEVILVSTQEVVLNGDQPVIEMPPATQEEPPISATLLITSGSNTPTPGARMLLPTDRVEPTQPSAAELLPSNRKAVADPPPEALNALSFLSTRRRPTNAMTTSTSAAPSPF